MALTSRKSKSRLDQPCILERQQDSALIHAIYTAWIKALRICKYVLGSEGNPKAGLNSTSLFIHVHAEPATFSMVAGMRPSRKAMLQEFAALTMPMQDCISQFEA